MNLARRTPTSQWSAATLWMLAAAGCVPYGDAEEPPAPADLPQEYAAPGGETASRGTTRQPLGALDVEWWRVFEDAGLDSLEERALAGNFSLRAAWTRIEQAQALARQASAPRWPQVLPQSQASWQRSGSGFFQSTINLSASVPVQYEVDWFAKYKGQAQAAEFEAQAARAEVGAAAMSLSANVAEAWYDLVEARARQALLEEQIESNETFLELTVLRFRQGLTSALDTHQQRQQVAATRAQLRLVQAQQELQENQLAVLVGEPPTGEDKPVAPPRDALPELEPLPRTGVPADLLVNRPDVRAAMKRVQASDEQVAAAIADHLPSLVLSASAGYAWQRIELRGDGTGTGGLGGSRHGAEYTAGADLTIPLFDGFQRKAQIDLRRAQLREEVADYRDTLQQAMLEVENAVTQEQRELDRIEDLEEQVEAASDALESARDRYRQGLTDFLNVLTALQGQQEAALTLLSARRQLLSHRIQLHRALGGTWTQDMEPPPPMETP
ncbi:MAG: efflux transporter outer membrane subunit [Myxococcota bacterium]